MHRTLARRPDALLILIALPALLASAGMAATRAAEDSHARYAPPPARAERVLTEGAVARLHEGGGRATLWVYFTDKGETDARTFARAVHAAGGRFTDRARDRRAREMGGRFVPDYYDVPVMPQYLDAIRLTGAAVRHVSRWLNAASVEADESAADRLASLPFVREIAPVATSKRAEPVGPTSPVGGEPGGPLPLGSLFREAPSGAAAAPSDIRQLLAPALDPPVGYGGSLAQLTEINAKAAQDSGYTGANVVVAMLDTGFNKAHTATVQLKRIAEYDFVFHDGETANQVPPDFTSAWDHGTGTWSVLGGYAPNNLIGPAYNASFLLAKTEDVRTETPVEEDNWLAAVEWADSIGADVISSSLAYFTFDNVANNHTYAQLNGQTTTVTKAAALAARRGIVVANAMANSGAALGSLQAPADADSILSVGAVDPSNIIAGFSSRGPTFDGRGKPEVVARGVSTWWAVAATNSFTFASGTSLATPLIGGAAAQVREAHPEWTVQQIRYALKVTADKAGTPDSTTYGWGRANVVAAIYTSPLGGPVFPKPFSLVAPANNSAVTTTPVVFRWKKAPDLNPGDVVSYQVIIKKAVVDSCIFDVTTSDTTVTYAAYLGPSQTYQWYVTATDLAGHARPSRDRFAFLTSATTDVAVSGTPPGAAQAVLYPNRPNPLRASTQIPFAISSATGSGAARVTLRIYDAGGRLVRTLFKDEIHAMPGICYQSWDGRDENARRVGSGIYYYRLTVAGRVYSRRMVVVR